MIEAALMTLLRAVPDTGIDGRVFLGHRPQTGSLSDLPAWTYERTGGDPTAGRSSDGHSGLMQSEFDVDCFAETATETIAMAEQVRMWLDNVRNVTLDGSRISDIRVLPPIDLSPEPRGGRSTPIYGRSLNLTIWHVERQAMQ